MPSSRLEYLFDRYLNNECTEGEKKELMSLLVKPGNEPIAKKLIERVIETTGSAKQLPEDRATSILQNILSKDNEVVVDRKRSAFTRKWFRVAAAASIIILSVTVYWFAKKVYGPAGVSAAKKSIPVRNGNKPMLMLADGSVIVLDTVKNGTLANVGAANINKGNGVLVYDARAGSTPNAPVSYNTLSTPRGAQYQVVLPDGSKVWLNAASSLRFPTAFTGRQRQVELSGEAYFEVTKNKAQPFEVNVGAMQVNVLGTHFNVNAYVEENTIKTSLLEGSVKVVKGNSISLLKPGQQAVLSENEEKVKIRKVDMDEVIGWKNGLFLFEEADIANIMQQLARWYDVEVVYAGKVPTQRFEGKISRSAALSEVLQILQLSGAKFKVEGKKITVL